MARETIEPHVLSRRRIAHADEYYDLLAYEFDPLGGYQRCPNQRLMQPFIRSRPALQAFMDLYDVKTTEKCGVPWYQIAPAFVQRVGEGLSRARALRWLDCQGFSEEDDWLDGVHVRETAMRRLAERLASGGALGRGLPAAEPVNHTAAGSEERWAVH